MNSNLSTKIFATLLVLSASSARGQQSVTFGGDHEFRPYEFADGEGNPSGINVDMANAIGRALGFEVGYQVGNWTDIRDRHLAGQIDVISMYRSTAREAFYEFSAPHAIFNHVIVMRQPVRQVVSQVDLQDLEVIVSRNTYSEEVLKERFPGKQFQLADSELDALEMLATGRHDAAIITEVTADEMLKRSELKDLRIAGPPLLPVEYSFAVVRGNTPLLIRLNQGLALIKESGELATIRNRWLGTKIDSQELLRVSIGLLFLVIMTFVAIITWNRSLSAQVAARTAEFRSELDAREKAEGELVRSYQLMERIVNGIRDAVFFRDFDGTFQLANQAALDHFGLSREKLVGKRLFEVLPRQTAEAMLQQDREILRTGQDFSEELEVYINGELNYCLKQKFPARDSAGRIFGIIGVIRNITEDKRQKAEKDALLHRELAARQEAERLNRVKDEFLLTLSHELRTPLAAIVGWTELLRSDVHLTSSQRHAVSVIDRNAKAEAQLINDLLESTAIMTGNLKLELRVHDFVMLVRRTLESVRPATAAKRIHLVFESNTDSAAVNGDDQRIQQVVWNLLNNAVKFTGEGGHVRVSLSKTDHYVELCIEDDGVGIDPEFLSSLFAKFSQEQTDISRQQGGLGIGLALSAYLVDLHGGTISAYSAGKNLGASFKIRFPLAGAGKALEADGEKRMIFDPAIARDLRVLMIDDTPDFRDMVEHALASYAMKIKTTDDPDEFFMIWKAWHPDVVMCDIGMPVVDGYTLMRKMRKEERSLATRTPSIALTAYSSDADIEQARLAGYDSHLAKPVSPSSIVREILSLV